MLTWAYSIREVCRAVCARWWLSANKHSTVLTVVPLSTTIYKKRSLPTHVFISAYKTKGLDQHSIALCEQVTALNFDRIIEHMGAVDEETLCRITEGVPVQVGVLDRYN